jgi:host factor-I protein
MDNATVLPNIQDGFFNALRKDRVNVTIYLLGGVKLTGRIRGFDKFSIILESGNLEQLIFKHAISTVSVPRSSVQHLHLHQAGAPSAHHQGVQSAPPAPAQTPADGSTPNP